MGTFPIIQHKNSVIQYATFCAVWHRESRETDFGIKGQLKCDGTRAETRCLSAKTDESIYKSAVASVQSTTGSRGVRISGSNAGYTMFRGSVKGTGYPLHSPVSPSLPLPCGTVCHHISTGVYRLTEHLLDRIRQSCNLNTVGLLRPYRDLFARIRVRMNTN